MPKVSKLRTSEALPKLSPRCETNHAAGLSHYRTRRVVRGQLLSKTGKNGSLRYLPGRVAREGARNHWACRPMIPLELLEPKGVGVCGRGVACYTGSGPVAGN